jgi:hypothetical protein
MREAGCPQGGQGTPLSRPRMSAETTLLQEGGNGAPRVEAVVYPHPQYPGNPWSQWGQGLVLPDGRFLSAIGDHLGMDGNAYVYEFDPRSRRLSLLTDVGSLAQDAPGAWGYGKIHGQMVRTECGDVYFATYWGDQPSPDDPYGGDLLFRMDPQRRAVVNLGVPVADRGLPSLASWPEGGLLYGEAADPRFESIHRGAFFAYDTRREEMIFRDDDPRHTGFRSVAVDHRGRAYFSVGDRTLAVYDPRTGKVADVPALLPGEWMRAATTPAPDGTIYGVTVEPDIFFALEPSGSIRSLGPARGYTTSLALDPERERFFSIPGAHGDSAEIGTPLVSVDGATGKQEVIVELNPLAERRLGFTLGGSYNVAYDPARQIVYAGLNGAPLSTGEVFGEVVLMIIHLT